MTRKEINSKALSVRHRWAGKALGNCNDNKAGLGTSCIKCGCVKEMIANKITYFIDDTVTDYAPKCDNRLIKTTQNG